MGTRARIGPADPCRSSGTVRVGYHSLAKLSSGSAATYEGSTHPGNGRPGRRATVSSTPPTADRPAPGLPPSTEPGVVVLTVLIVVLLVFVLVSIATR